MSLTLELAKAEDLDYIVEVYNSVIPGGEVTADTELVTVEDWRPWFLLHNNAARPVWILHENGIPCGWMSFSDYKRRAAYFITAEISIYLDPKFRHRGLGERFIRMGLEYIRTQKVKNVLAVIFSSNKASMQLFEKIGFTSWGVLPDACLINGTEKDVTILGLQLK